MKKLIVFTFIFCFCWFLYGQQVPQYSLWSQNSYLLNPAVTGIKKVFSFNTGYRMQYAGLPGAPQTGYLLAQGKIKTKKEKYLSPTHGFGGIVNRDVFGGFTNFSVHLSYAIHLQLGREKTLSFGTALGAQQLGFDQSNATTIDPDVAIATNVSNFLFPNFNLGAWFAAPNYYFGASINQLTRSVWSNIGFDSRFLLHGNFTAGLKYTNAKDITFLPKLIARLGPNTPLNLELQSLFDFQQRFVLGLGFRSNDALIALFKIRIKDVQIAYSYDFVISRLRQGNAGGHELMLNINTARNRFLGKENVPVFE